MLTMTTIFKSIVTILSLFYNLNIVIVIVGVLFLRWLYA